MDGIRLALLMLTSLIPVGVYLGVIIYLSYNGKKRLPGAKKRRRKLLPLFYPKKKK